MNEYDDVVYWRDKALAYEKALRQFEADGWGPYVRHIRKLMKEKK